MSNVTASYAAAPDASAGGQVALEMRDVAVHYGSGEQVVRALDGVSCQFASQSCTAVIGRSGSGKSTLVSVLGLLRQPTHGEVIFRGANIADLSGRQVARLRAGVVGVVYQSFHVDKSATALANILLAWHFLPNLRRQDAKRRAHDLLELLGIGELAHRKVGEMSGGQRQRVAIARAMLPNPAVLLADEPTGNLDEETAEQVFSYLMGLRELGTAVIVVTHDEAFAGRADRTLVLEKGRLRS